MFKHIFVPLDGSGFAEQALPVALRLAESWGASIDLVTVSAPEAHGEDLGVSGLVADSGAPLAREQARGYLEGVESRIRSSGFDGAIGGKALPAGNIWRALTTYLLEAEADFAVMTTHGLGPLKRAWLGSTADGFIRHAPVPVLLIPPDAGSGDGAEDRGAAALSASPVHFSRILFPLDGSHQGERTLEIAAPLASEDTLCFLLRAVAPFVPGGSPYLPHLVRQIESQAEVKKAAEEYLGAVSRRSPCGNTEIRVVTSPQPAIAILKAASESGADLIAISTAGRGGVSRFLLGSVADKVVRGARVPVLVVRWAAEGGDAEG